MPLKIETRCQACGCKQTWVYREGRGLMQSHRGCRGGSCVSIQEVSVREVDEDEAARIETNLVEKYNVTDKRPDANS